MISTLFFTFMNNISKYFDRYLKKKYLSGDSNPEEERKKAREGISNTNNTDDSVDDEVIQQANSTSDILEILRKLEAKVAEIYNFYNETRYM